MLKVIMMGIIMSGIFWTPVFTQAAGGGGESKPAEPSGEAPVDLGPVLKPVLIKVGLFSWDRPTRLVRLYRPLLDMIEASLAKRMKRPVKIKTVISQDLDESIHQLVRGHVDLSVMDPCSYVDALERNSLIRVLAQEAEHEKTSHEYIFVTQSQKPMRALSQIKNETVAFGYDNTACGRYMPQKELLWHGLRAKDLAGFDYVGGDEQVWDAVSRGKFGVGIVRQDFMDERGYADYRIVHRFVCPNRLWVARKGFPEEVFESFQKIMLALKGKAALKPLGMDAFIKQPRPEVQEVRESMIVNWTGY